MRLAEQNGIQVLENGIAVPTNLPLLIDEVRVEPELDNNYFDEKVQRLVKASGLELTIKQLDMDKDPVY